MHRLSRLAAALVALSVIVSLATAAPSSAADPAETVRAALLTTDAAVESGEFNATLSERGWVGKRRVISSNSMSYAFNLDDGSRLSQDLAVKMPGANLNLRFVAVGKKNYFRGGGVNYWFPVTSERWRKQFRVPHVSNLIALVNTSLSSLGDWRDDGAAYSDGVAIENYSAATDFPTLASVILPNLTKIVHDAQFDLFMSNVKKWQDATPANGMIPRVTFGVDNANILRRVHVEAPSALMAQGYELLGDFETTSINQRVAIRKLPNAHRVTSKNVAKFFGSVFGITE
jgi:hypothetical protein